jgi:microcystin-dependent protein
MLVTNQTSQDLYFGPLHLGAGIGTTLTVDDTSDVSLYLKNDSVADALNNAYNSGKITVSGQAEPFPRPTGTPEVLHGDGTPEGLVFAPQGSVYMRRDGVVSNGGGLYIKTTGVTYSTGWIDMPTASGASAVLPAGAIVSYGGATAPTGWLLCDGSAVSRTVYSLLFNAVGTLFGAGDGSTTFNVPDLRGRTSIGYAASGGHVDVNTVGKNDGVALANRRPKHRHTAHSHSITHGGNTISQTTDFADNTSGGGRMARSGATSGADSLGTSSVDGGSGNSNDSIDAPAYLVVNYIIKT